MRSSVKNKIIWTIALPIIFGNLAQTLIALTDTAFLGRVSAVALGASMMAGIYYYIYSTLAWGFAIGMYAGRENTCVESEKRNQVCMPAGKTHA